MILEAISALDCVAFVIFLVPNLLYQAGLVSTIRGVLQVLPFLVINLPASFLYERYGLADREKSPFCRKASVFQDIVIRCVRYAFANIPASIGRVFFSKGVALPFFRFRLLRHGYLHSPIEYHEVNRPGLKGVWAAYDSKSKPDFVLYYLHGGGFSMGSCYFYLEFLMAWLTCMKIRGFRNPALFALDYTLVPDAQWPVQFREVREGYRFLRESLGEGSSAKICVAGDSAGATLILSMLLHPGSLDQEPQYQAFDQPGLAVLLSPWTHLVSELNTNTRSDYLDNQSLHLYARQYAGHAAVNDPLISPGLSTGKWKKASPIGGYRILYGAEEVLAGGITETAGHMAHDGATVKLHRQPAGIHAWPVVNLFLGETRQERLEGLERIADYIMSSGMENNIAKQ